MTIVKDLKGGIMFLVPYLRKAMMVNVQLSDFNKEWFISKEQAEKRYKELKEKSL